jgi:hypothetical protein
MNAVGLFHWQCSAVPNRPKCTEWAIPAQSTDLYYNRAPSFCLPLLSDIYAEYQFKPAVKGSCYGLTKQT